MRGLIFFLLAAVSAVGQVGTHYSPAENLEALDVQELSKAQHTIDLAAFSLTDQPIIEALKADAGRGVVIRIYLDRGELEAACRGDATCSRSPLHELFGVPGVTILVKHSKVLMHLKSYIVDGAVVRDGSANFSPQGEKQQDNSAVFSPATPDFEVKFTAMWTRADNLSVSDALK